MTTVVNESGRAVKMRFPVSCSETEVRHFFRPFVESAHTATGQRVTSGRPVVSLAGGERLTPRFLLIHFAYQLLQPMRNRHLLPVLTARSAGLVMQNQVPETSNRETLPPTDLSRT